MKKPEKPKAKKSTTHRCSSCDEMRTCRTRPLGLGSTKLYLCAVCDETPALKRRLLEPDFIPDANEVLLSMARMTNRILDAVNETKRVARRRT